MKILQKILSAIGFILLVFVGIITSLILSIPLTTDKIYKFFTNPYLYLIASIISATILFVCAAWLYVSLKIWIVERRVIKVNSNVFITRLAIVKFLQQQLKQLDFINTARVSIISSKKGYKIISNVKLSVQEKLSQLTQKIEDFVRTNCELLGITPVKQIQVRIKRFL